MPKTCCEISKIHKDRRYPLYKSMLAYTQTLSEGHTRKWWQSSQWHHALLYIGATCVMSHLLSIVCALPEGLWGLVPIRASVMSVSEWLVTNCPQFANTSISSDHRQGFGELVKTKQEVLAGPGSAAMDSGLRSKVVVFWISTQSLNIGLVPSLLLEDLSGSERRGGQLQVVKLGVEDLLEGSDDDSGEKGWWPG